MTWSALLKPKAAVVASAKVEPKATTNVPKLVAPKTVVEPVFAAEPTVIKPVVVREPSVVKPAVVVVEKIPLTPEKPKEKEPSKLPSKTIVEEKP